MRGWGQAETSNKRLCKDIGLLVSVKDGQFGSSKSNISMFFNGF